MESFLQPSHEHFEVTELIEKGFMGKKCNVFCIVVGLVNCTAFVDFLCILGLVGINTFQDTESPTLGVRKWKRICYPQVGQHPTIV